MARLLRVGMLGSVSINQCLGQVYSWQSLSSYARSYRKLQARFNFSCVTDIPHLCTTTLMLKVPSGGLSQQGPNRNHGWGMGKQPLIIMTAQDQQQSAPPTFARSMQGAGATPTLQSSSCELFLVDLLYTTPGHDHQDGCALDVNKAVVSAVTNPEIYLHLGRQQGWGRLLWHCGLWPRWSW